MEFKNPFSLTDFLEKTGFSCSQVQNSNSKETILKGIGSPKFLKENQVVFLDSKTSFKSLSYRPVFAFIEKVSGEESFAFIKVDSVIQVLKEVVENLKLNFKNLIEEYIFISNTQDNISSLVHPSAIVEGIIEENVQIGSQCFIAKNTLLKKGVVLEAGVIIHENVVIAENTYIQSGVVIGGSGFGFFKKNLSYQHIPHFAGVYIGKKCWIGSNTIICAGVLEPTTLGDSCYLDSLVQIAHNVFLGSHARMASQSGIAGSTCIGKRFTIGGNSSIGGHLELGDDVTVAACSGVTKSICSNQTVGGFPAQDLKKWKQQQIWIRNSKNLKI